MGRQNQEKYWMQSPIEGQFYHYFHETYECAHDLMIRDKEW